MDLTQAVADVALAWTKTTVGGQPAIVADIPLAPNGDAAQVVGTARLQQSIQWMLAVPTGAYFAIPSWGNQFWREVGRPSTVDDETYLSMAEATEAAFLQQQAVAAAQGYLSLDEQVQAFTATSIDRTVPGQVAVGLTIQTRAGTTITAAQPFTD